MRYGQYLCSERFDMYLFAVRIHYTNCARTAPVSRQNSDFQKHIQLKTALFISEKYVCIM